MLTSVAFSAIEILRKVEDVDFLRKLKLYDFVPQVYAVMRAIKAGEGDIVSLFPATSS